MLALLKKRGQLMAPLAQAMATVALNARDCTVCGNIGTTDICPICADPARATGEICVVEDVADLWAMERGQAFKGRYHVLGGTLSALDAVGPDELGIPRLAARVADQAFASYDMSGRGPPLFMLGGVPAAGQSVTQLREAILGQIRRIAEQGVDADELERLRVQYVASRVYQRDSLMAQATELAGLEMAGLGWQAADRLLERIRAVQPEAVQAVARRHFSEDQLTVVSLDPQPIEPSRSPSRLPLRPH